LLDMFFAPDNFNNWKYGLGEDQWLEIINQTVIRTYSGDTLTDPQEMRFLVEQNLKHEFRRFMHVPLNDATMKNHLFYFIAWLHDTEDPDLTENASYNDFDPPWFIRKFRYYEDARLTTLITHNETGETNLLCGIFIFDRRSWLECDSRILDILDIMPYSC
ncbi:MAG: hypothetical protein LUB61_03685, partial [Eggerthellaceae bacterium]|nr:hypothetical protein [Eggerthellaceae bacterium]